MTGFLPENRSSEPSAAPAVEGSARNPFLFRKCLPSAHICRRTDISRAPPSTRSVGIALGLQCGSLHAGPCDRSGPLYCAWPPCCRCCSTLRSEARRVGKEGVSTGGSSCAPYL